MAYNLIVAFALAVSISASQVAIAQSQKSSNPSLEERLQKQEQLILELQRRLSELEAAASEKDPKSEAQPELIPKDLASVNIDRQSSHTLLVQQIDLGEVKEQTTVVLSGDELISDEFPSSWPMFGSDMRMKIGGYLKSDFVYDFDGTTDKRQFLMSTIPVEGTPEFGSSPYFEAFASETRINFDARRVKPGSPPLRGFVEGDFFSDGSNFRLRHAYATAGDFLAGQTWTTLSFLESMPFMIDFAAGDALFGGRSTQVRYTHKLDNGWKVALGLEGLSLQGIDNAFGLPGTATTKLPLVAARAEKRWNTGVMFLGSSVAQLHWDGGANGPSDEALQYNFVFAGRQFVTDATYLTWNTSYGEGSGENIIAFAGSRANAVLEADGTLQTFPAASAMFGLGHQWNAEWSSNLSYAYGWLDTPETRDSLALKRGGIGHLNVIWKPVRQFSTGLEYIWGSQRVQNDALGRAERLQFMAKFGY